MFIKSAVIALLGLPVPVHSKDLGYTGVLSVVGYLLVEMRSL
jgi:hypothetical protein